MRTRAFGAGTERKWHLSKEYFVHFVLCIIQFRYVFNISCTKIQAFPSLTSTSISRSEHFILSGCSSFRITTQRSDLNIDSLCDTNNSLLAARVVNAAPCRVS